MEIFFRAIVVVLRLRQQITAAYQPHSKGISDNQDRLHPQLARTGGLLPSRPLGYNQKGNQENRYIILFVLFGMEYLTLGWSRSGVGVGFGVDIFRPESESLIIRRLRNPGQEATCVAVGSWDCCFFHIKKWAFQYVFYRNFSRSWPEIDIKNTYLTTQTENCQFDLSHLVTTNDLDLRCAH